MNSPIPKFTFSPVAKRVFVRNYRYENICYLCVHLQKNEVFFSCETFSTSTRPEKEANGSSKVEVKSAYVPIGPLGQRLFICIKMKSFFM